MSVDEAVRADRQHNQRLRHAYHLSVSVAGDLCGGRRACRRTRHWLSLAARRRAPVAAAPERPASPVPTLSAAVIDALGTGVVVLDRDERLRLVNPAARRMGVLSGDRLERARSRRADPDRDPRGPFHSTPRSGCRPVDSVGSRLPWPRPRFRCATQVQPARVGSVALLIEDVTEAHRLEARTA